MDITLVGHASVIVTTDDVKILTDPWLSGTAFNGSWALDPEPVFDLHSLPGISHLWLSHEHPDHFHVPTLRSLPEAFKKSVIVLLQKRNSRKILEAMHGMGYRHFVELRNRQWVNIAPSTQVYCYQAGLSDSLLGVEAGGDRILNVNDAELSLHDIGVIRREFGTPRVVLNQYSLAGCDGYGANGTILRAAATRKLERILSDHRQLGAKQTIPFASFVRFCRTDNAYLNTFANSANDVARHFGDAGQQLALLRPGDVLSRHRPSSNDEALAWFSRRAGATPEPLASEEQSLEALADAYAAFVKDVRRRYPLVHRLWLQPITFRLLDCKTIALADFASDTLQFATDGAADIEVNCQPLWFAFRHPFGFETLAVSGRFKVVRNRRAWRRLKSLSILMNQELDLRMVSLLNPATVSFIAARIRHGLLRQIRSHRAASTPRQAIEPPSAVPLRK
jgi:UDP-MurNAc hydroxylase